MMWKIKTNQKIFVYLITLIVTTTKKKDGKKSPQIKMENNIYNQLTVFRLLFYLFFYENARFRSQWTQWTHRVTIPHMNYDRTQLLTSITLYCHCARSIRINWSSHNCQHVFFAHSFFVLKYAWRSLASTASNQNQLNLRDSANRFWTAFSIVIFIIQIIPAQAIASFHTKLTHNVSINCPLLFFCYMPTIPKWFFTMRKRSILDNQFERNPSN